MRYKEIKKVDIDPETMPTDWYNDTYTISTSGGRGIIWERTNKGETIFTISTDTVYSKKMIVRSGYGKQLNLQFKKHFVLTQTGLDNLYALDTEKNL